MSDVCIEHAGPVLTAQMAVMLADAVLSHSQLKLKRKVLPFLVHPRY